MGLLFFPRGGSAQVARYLAPCLGDAGWTVSLVTGSLGRDGDETHAGTFFAGLDGVHALDYSDPHVPMHPSFEDRPGAPDPVLARVPPSDAQPLAALCIENSEVTIPQRVPPKLLLSSEMTRRRPAKFRKFV